MLRLTPRLAAVADLVPQGVRLADVGTDHGYLPARLLLDGRISRAIATDIRPGPLATARSTATRWDLTEAMELRLCDGLAAVKADEVDAVTIAGMGGETILAILTASPWALTKTCILQPMSSIHDLRGGLGELNVHIGRERLAQEGDTLYVVMDLAPGREELTPAECWVGRLSAHENDPLWPVYLDQELHRAQRALEGVKRSNKGSDAVRRQWLEAVLADLVK